MTDTNETTEAVQDVEDQGVGDYLDNYRENDYPEDPSDYRDVEFS